MLDPAMTGRRDHPSRPRPLLRTIIGDVLRRTRLAQGRTLAEVARIARVSLPYLSELERGRKEASSEILAAICEALHIELPDLLAAAGRDLRNGRDRRAAVIRISPIATDNPPGPLAEAEPGEPADDVAVSAPTAGEEQFVPTAADEQSAPADAQLAMVISLTDASPVWRSMPAASPPSPGEARCLLRVA